MTARATATSRASSAVSRCTGTRPRANCVLAHAKASGRAWQAKRTLQVRFVGGERADAGELEPKADAKVQYNGKAVVVKRK